MPFCLRTGASNTHSSPYAERTHIGATWTDLLAGTDLAGTPFSSCASSSQGGRLFAATYLGYVWASDNYGQTWVKIKQEGGPYSGVACDATGTIVLAVQYGGQMYRLVPPGQVPLHREIFHWHGDTMRHCGQRRHAHKLHHHFPGNVESF